MRHRHRSSPPDPSEPPAFFDALLALAADAGRERVFVADIVHALGERALVVLMLLFALPNAVPMPPGTSTVLGLPLLLFALQLALGLKPWLPRAIAVRSLPRADFGAGLARAAPWLRRAQRWLRPRLELLTSGPSTRLTGALCVLLAAIVLLPIPFGNIPPALAIALLALGLLYRDGAWILAGVATALASMAIAWGVGLALVAAGTGLLQRLFG